MNYDDYSSLPDWVKEVTDHISGDAPDEWANSPIPALQNRSLLAVMNSGHIGELEVREYLSRVVGKFF